MEVNRQFEYYSNNHPDDLHELKERGEIGEVEYFTRAVELGRSYESVKQTFACYDIIRFTENRKQEALGMLLGDEEARKIRDGDAFKSDQYYKGVILSMESIQRHIEFRLQDLEDNLEFLKEAQKVE